MTGFIIITILGGCLIVIVYRDTCRASKMEPPLPVPTPIPELRIEKRNGAMWSVATYETGAEVWQIVRRAA